MNTAWLEWIANQMVGVPQQQAAALPREQFHCLLDELPLHLVPKRRLAAERQRATRREPLFLNPQCSFSHRGDVPTTLANRRDLLENFALQGTIAWVSDPATEALLPFWLGPKTEAAIQDLQPGEPVPDTVADDVRPLLAGAGILVTKDHAELRRQEWQKMIARSGPSFREVGYVPIGSLIHPFHVAALRRYYRYLIRSGQIPLGDEQSPRRYVAHNESVARFFHHQLARVVSNIAREEVKPSYAYVASYLSAAELRKHTDREQCEFSVSLCVDFTPEPRCETRWPLHLETSQGTVTVYQALGDGLIYRGRRLPHYRYALPEGCTSTSIFFHYVSADFAGPLD